MVIFTVLVTLIPGIVLRLPTVEYDLPELDEVRTGEEGGGAGETKEAGGANGA